MTKYGIAALALAGAVALSATDASAQWRRHHWDPGIAAGVAAGALIGSAVAARPYGYYYDAPGYFYEAPVAGYYYDDAYVAPRYGSGWGYRYTCGGSYGQRRDCSAGDTGR